MGEINFTAKVPYGYCQCGCGQKTAIAKKNNTKYRQVKGEPVYFILGHQVTKKYKKRKLSAPRFWANVNTTENDNECWEWAKSLQGNGYGRVTINGRKTSTHRIAYELAYGEIPQGLCIMHSCDNPKCCNPKHLSAGTHLDNMKDRDLKERGGKNKLSWDKVDYIKSELQNGKKCSELARELNVHYNTIYYVKIGKRWVK